MPNKIRGFIIHSTKNLLIEYILEKYLSSATFSKFYDIILVYLNNKTY
jgi:hypothetical protein